MNKIIKTIGATLGDTVVGAGKSFIGGYVSEYFNKRAEKRADARNRKMLLDQPGLTAEGRRRAGLNPYGDATIPGVQGQSTTDITPLVGTNAFSQTQIAMQQLENDTLVANSQANRNNAEADAIRGEEERNTERFPLELQKRLVDIAGQEKSNQYQDIVNEIADETKQDKILSSHYSLRELYDALGTNKQLLINLRKDGKIKDAVYDKTVEEGNLIRQQIFEKEIKNTLGVREFEFLTGRDYYTQELVGAGKWQLEYDNLDASSRAERYNAEMLSKRLDQYEIELILDRLLDTFEILDIINDDVFSWYNAEQERELRRELEKHKSRDRRNRYNSNNSLTLLVHLLPFIMKKLA